MSNGFLRRAVIISDVNVLKEAFNNPSALGRPPQEFMQMHQDEKNRGKKTCEILIIDSLQ